MSNTPLDASQRFAAQVDAVQDELVQDVIDIARNKKLKIGLRLKATQMLWDRTIPTKKSIDHKTNQQVNIFYMSPQEVAAARLSGQPTPLNDLAKEKRIEITDLPALTELSESAEL